MKRGLLLIPLLVMLLAPFGAVQAQGDTRYFTETQHNVHGGFLEYWNNHGALAQQGYPLTEEFDEISQSNGQHYTVQYFERAVFEFHPENQPPNTILLSLLGKFLYRQKYPGGAPGQVANQQGGRLFTETNHWVGGRFLQYWTEHGGLAQQGFPISDEFTEISQSDSKPYMVQYFERAVFEYHPENSAPNDVLLSQLGKFQLRSIYPPGTNAAANPAQPLIGQQPTATPVASQPTPTPVAAQPTAAPTGDGGPQNIKADSSPRCGVKGTVFQVTAYGFQDNERINYGVYYNGNRQMPINTSQFIHGSTFTVPLDSGDLSGSTSAWAGLLFEGVDSHNVAEGYFYIADTQQGCANLGSGGSVPAPTPTQQTTARTDYAARNGTGTMKTDAFYLVAGNYKIDWAASDDGGHSGVGCYHGAFLQSVDGSEFETIATTPVESGKSVKGTTYAYNLKATNYYFNVTSGCDWAIVMEKQ